MCGVCGVLDYAGCFSEAAGSVDRVNGWEAGLSDGLGFVLFLNSFVGHGRRWLASIYCPSLVA